MGLPFYKSPSSEALRRQAESQAATQQSQADPRRARSGAPPPTLRREDAQRLSSQPPYAATTGTQERPIDLTRRNLEVEAQRHPVPPPRSEAPLPSTEDDMEESDAAASAALSRYSRTRFNSSELASPSDEDELRLPDYGTPDVDWSTPEIEAASTPPRAAQSSPPASQTHRPQPQTEAGPSQAAQGQQVRQASGGRERFVQVVVDEGRGPLVQVRGGEGQAIPPSRRLPPLPRPSDATIRGPRRQRLGQSRSSTHGTSSGSQSSRSSGSRSPGRSPQMRTRRSGY